VKCSISAFGAYSLDFKRGANRATLLATRAIDALDFPNECTRKN
jgi:hypothetical protein